MSYPKDGSLQVASAFAGVGTIVALPAPSANGTLLPARPASAQGMVLLLGPNDSVTLTYTSPSQGAPASAPPAATCATFAGAGAGTSDVEVPQFFAPNLSCYLVAASGNPRMRWM